MTVTLNAWSIAYPTISNRIRASIYVQTDPQAIVAEIIDSTPGHPARIWSFLGLPRQNYGFFLDEIDGGGAVVRNIADFVVTPGTIDGLLSRLDEQPQVGITPGFVTGASSFVFDGAETFTGSGIFKPNYLGWDIVPSELTGRGILVAGVDYNWDKVTGTFTLLIVGDVFADGNFYNIHFEPVDNPAGNSYPTLRDFNINVITVDTTLDSSFFGDKLIIDSSVPYLEVTLPDINTVVEGRPLMVQTLNTGSMYCVKFLAGASLIKFVRGSLYMLPDESLWLYKYINSGTPEWRVSEADGNFKTVGQSVSYDSVQADVINAQSMDGSSLNKFQYARIYNELVLHLPLTQVVDYDLWSTGNNQYYFSFANSAFTPDEFYFPDRRGLFERNNLLSGNAGDKIDDQVGESTFMLEIDTGDSFTGHPYPPTAVGKGLITNSPVSLLQPVTINAGLETQPNHYLNNKYVLI